MFRMCSNFSFTSFDSKVSEVFEWNFGTYRMKRDLTEPNPQALAHSVYFPVCFRIIAARFKQTVGYFDVSRFV